MSGSLIPLDFLKPRIPLQPISKLVMNINNSNNDNTILNCRSDVIEIVENYVLNVQEENFDDVQSLIRDLEDFIISLKTNPGICKSNSVISIVDIKIDVEDDTVIERNNLYEDSCTLTEPQSTFDIHTQTVKLKNDYNQDFKQCSNHLRGKVVEIDDMCEVLKEKRQKLLNTLEIAHDKLQSLAALYNPLLDKKMKTFKDEATDTCDSWLRSFEASKERLKQLPALKDQFEEVTTKIQKLDERHGALSREAEEQFVMMEDLAANNEQMVPIIDALATEFGEAREINDFLELENRGLVATADAVHADFRANLTLHAKTVRDATLSFTADRAAWLSERRALEHKFNENELNFNMDRGQRTFNDQRIAEMIASVRNYPLCGSEHENCVIALRKKLTLLADQCLSRRQDRARWEEEAQFLEQAKSDEQNNVDLLTEERDELRRNVDTAKERQEKYRACVQELLAIYVGGDGDDVEPDLFSRVLDKFGL